MAVTYATSDLIDLERFPFAWRIGDPRRAAIPNRELAEFLPLSDRKAREIAGKFSPFSQGYSFPFDYGRFHATRETSLAGRRPTDIEEHTSWFLGLPVDPPEEVYLSWRVAGACAAVATWRFFAKHYAALWYPHDVLSVFDDTLGWIVILGPEECAIFLEPGAVDPELPKQHPAYGLSLLRVSQAPEPQQGSF